MARLLQAGLQQRLGQPVIVDNKPGANGIIGVDAVAKAAPDGYTFGVFIAAYAANTTLYPKLPYDPKKDLAGVSLMGISPLVAAVAMNAPFKTLAELVAYGKSHPGKISYASSGTGSAAHLTSELMRSVTGVDMVHVPYKGASPALADLLGGQVPLFLDPPPNLIQPAKAGKIRLIGVASDKRLAALPDVPPSQSRATRAWWAAPGPPCWRLRAPPRPSCSACPKRWRASSAAPRSRAGWRRPWAPSPKDRPRRNAMPSSPPRPPSGPA